MRQTLRIEPVLCIDGDEYVPVGREEEVMKLSCRAHRQCHHVISVEVLSLSLSPTLHGRRIEKE